MDIIGQNGNDGLHYDIEPDVEPREENGPRPINKEPTKRWNKNKMILTIQQENTMSKKFEYKSKLFRKFINYKNDCIERNKILDTQKIRCGLEK